MSKNKKKILFVCTEGWFFQSHFLPLAKAAHSLPDTSVCLVANIGEEQESLEHAGIKTLPLNFKRSSLGIVAAIQLLWALISVLRRERPDVIHFIALKPILLGGLAALFAPFAAKIYHVTGLGTLAEGQSRKMRFVRSIIFRLPALYMREARSWLIVENPDDLSFLQEYGMPKTVRVSLLGGAGVNPDIYKALPPVPARPVKAVFVGRMIWTKGVDVLVRAMDIVHERQGSIHLDLYGAPDQGNPKSISQQVLQQWDAKPNVSWHGFNDNILNVWREAEICIISTRTREGMPRAMLEAAACGRALIVTDVPGCRHFVRNGVEGFVVPPENPQALAQAIKTLEDNPSLRAIMGHNARQRVLEGYTEAHVQRSIEGIFRKLLDNRPVNDDHAITSPEESVEASF